jgi:hypothetical protein
MKLHLLSFGTSFNFGGALTRILVQSTQWQNNNQSVFASVNIFNEKTLQHFMPEWWNTHGTFVQQNSRGFGFWSWRSELIKKCLANLPQNEILLWIDCGCQLNFNGYNRLVDYYNLANQHNILAFDVGMPEKQWTKIDTLERVSKNFMDSANSGQLIGGINFWKNTAQNIDILTEIQSICCANNYHYVDDSQSNKSELPEFQDHRHDQSITSLVLKNHGSYIALPDETYWAPDWHTRGSNYPIWAIRNKSTAVL